MKKKKKETYAYGEVFVFDMQVYLLKGLHITEYCACDFFVKQGKEMDQCSAPLPLAYYRAINHENWVVDLACQLCMMPTRKWAG